MKIGSHVYIRDYLSQDIGEGATELSSTSLLNSYTGIRLAIGIIRSHPNGDIRTVCMPKLLGGRSSMTLLRVSGGHGCTIEG